MKAWDILRQQHIELQSLAREISTLLDLSPRGRDTTRVRLKLATWARKLRVHLALEERLVYTRLLKCVEPLVARKAKEHQSEMKSLQDRLERFASARLADDLSEAGCSPSFVEVVNQMFTTVTTKFRLEESELYRALAPMSLGDWAVHDAATPADDDATDP